MMSRNREHDVEAWLRGGARIQHAVDEALDKTAKAMNPLDVVLATRKRRRVMHPEDDLQRAVCKYWQLAYPETWPKTFHPPNGLAARNKKLAAIFKGLGVKPGVFDLLCIARRGIYHGFALELKAEAGRMSDAQEAWLCAFCSEGWYACIAYDADAAVAALDRYHRGES